MFPEEYKNTLLRLAEADEDMKTLLGLFYLLKECTTEETLVKNFAAITGKDCRGLLKVLRRAGVVKIGTHDEYLCLSGYEEFFNDIAARYVPQPGNLSTFFETAVEEGDSAALKLIELLLKLGKMGLAGFTQYELIRSEISEQFSREVFYALEQRLINKKLCIYGKKTDNEFLELYQSEDKRDEVGQQLSAWRTKLLTAMPVKETIEQAIEELVAEARRLIRDSREKMAEQAGLSVHEIESTFGSFSGFTIDESFLFMTGDTLVDHDKLYIAITDSLSRYDAWEWRDFPVVFITEKTPKWLGDLDAIFSYAYPRLSDRKIAIVIPHQAAYANFKQNLLAQLVNRLGITEISELKTAEPLPHVLRKIKGPKETEDFVY